DDFELVCTHGALRLYAGVGMFWGGMAVRLLIEGEVAAPPAYVHRRLAAMTAPGGAYYPFSDAASCDVLGGSGSGGAGSSGCGGGGGAGQAAGGRRTLGGALGRAMTIDVTCAHWTHFAGARRCAMIRFVVGGSGSGIGSDLDSEVSAPDHVADAAAATATTTGATKKTAAAKTAAPAPVAALPATAAAAARAAAAAAVQNSSAAADLRPTIVFATIDHPILREWMLPAQEIEVFPSGIVLDSLKADSAGPQAAAAEAAAGGGKRSGAGTRVQILLGWDSKGALQSFAKMAFLAERAERLEALDGHLRTIEEDYSREYGLALPERPARGQVAAATTEIGRGAGGANAAAGIARREDQGQQGLLPREAGSRSPPLWPFDSVPPTRNGVIAIGAVPARGGIGENGSVGGSGNGSSSRDPAAGAGVESEVAVLRRRLRASDDARLRLESELALTRAAAAARDADATAALAETERTLAMKEIELAASQAEALGLRRELEMERSDLIGGRAIRRPSRSSSLAIAATGRGSGSGVAASGVHRIELPLSDGDATPPAMPSSPAVRGPPMRG
ncbi:unnamed protein product, partial [Phaeothamnion confervicola]